MDFEYLVKALGLFFTSRKMQLLMKSTFGSQRSKIRKTRKSRASSSMCIVGLKTCSVGLKRTGYVTEQP